MSEIQNAFFLLKSDTRKSSSELARFISRFPGFKEVWLTEGEYSFVARFNAPAESLPRLVAKLRKHGAVLEIICLPAPVVLKGSSREV